MPDDVEAARWFRLAAEQGDADAQAALGLMCAEGNGMPQDIVLAHMWWNLVAAQGDEQAKKNRDLAARRMTPTSSPRRSAWRGSGNRRSPEIHRDG